MARDTGVRLVRGHDDEAWICGSSACVGMGVVRSSAGAQLRRWGARVIIGQIIELTARTTAQIRAHYANVCEDFVCRCNIITQCDVAVVLRDRGLMSFTVSV
jgi:hypothetical protein